jgi:hypothetical protein
MILSFGMRQFVCGLYLAHSLCHLAQAIQQTGDPLIAHNFCFSGNVTSLFAISSIETNPLHWQVNHISIAYLLLISSNLLANFGEGTQGC